MAGACAQIDLVQSVERWLYCFSDDAFAEY